MRSALLGCCLLAALLAPASPASVSAWSDSVQANYDKLVAEVQEERWNRHEGAQVSRCSSSHIRLSGDPGDGLRGVVFEWI